MKLIAYVLSFDIGKIVINFACFNSMLVGAFKRVFVRTISHYQTLRHVCGKVGGISPVEYMKGVRNLPFQSLLSPGLKDAFHVKKS